MDSNTNTTPIKITRLSNVVYSSRDVVMLALDKVYHLIGQFILADYRNELGKIDTILVIGKLNGTGRDAYNVISTAGDFVVNKVDDLADVSQVPHGAGVEIHLARLEDPDNEDKLDWFIITIDENNARTSKVIDRSRIFRNLDDGYRWFYIKETRTLKREDDFLSQAENEEYINFLLNMLNKPNLIISYNNQTNNNYYFTEDNVTNPTFNISIINFKGEDITEYCTIELNGNIIEPDEESIHDFTITGQFSSDTEFNFGYTYLEEIESEKTIKFFFPSIAYTGRYQIISDEITLDGELTPRLIYSDLTNVDVDYDLTIPTEDIEEGEIPTLYRSILLMPTNFNQFLHIFDINGLDYINDYEIIENFEYDGDVYTAYVKNDGAIIGSFRQKFTYENEILLDPYWERENEKNNYYTKGEVLELINEAHSNIYRELLNDRTVERRKTWSSYKIYQELDEIKDRLDEETRTRFTLQTTAQNDRYYADTSIDTTMTVSVNTLFDNELVDIDTIPDGWTRTGLGTYAQSIRGTFDENNTIKSQLFTYEYNKLRISKSSEEKTISMVFPAYYGLTDSNIGIYSPEDMTQFIRVLTRTTNSIENQPITIQNTSRNSLFMWFVTLGKAEVIVNSNPLRMDLYTGGFVSPFNSEIKLDKYNFYIFPKPVEPQTSISINLTLPTIDAEDFLNRL